MTCAGADILVFVADAPMAQVWAVSTALEVDAPLTRAGADWICLVPMMDARMTHAGTTSISSIVDAPMIAARADSTALATDTSSVHVRADLIVFVEDASMARAGLSR